MSRVNALYWTNPFCLQVKQFPAELSVTGKGSDVGHMRGLTSKILTRFYMLNIMNETSYSFMSSLCNLANQCGIKEMKGFWSSQCLNKNTDVSQKMRTPFRISTPNNNHGKNCWLDSHDLIIIDTLYKRDKPGCHSCKNWRFTEFYSKAYW